MESEDFIDANDPAAGTDRFSLENSKLLAIEVDEPVFAKVGAMVAYTGELSFTGKSSAEGGITGFLKDAATSEGTDVMQAEGSGTLYVADGAKEIQVLDLDEGETISVNGDDVLAFEDRVDYEISTIDSLAGSSTGGLTNVFLEGPGQIAITTHGDPIVLEPPVTTDPAATVAWSGTAAPSSSVNRSLSDMVGQSSGETYQLAFEGTDGFVVVQPFEERQP
ncbi:AIM24 family protein [Haloarcula montana]|uniref:AIM24 family protein n=1 Tax=Haloarcula montana TaxID=3111776 RepID=UPI002D7A375C|nr:AIM24 family protein [Haloarcula sp. GH36]